jgi:hypothetical protein
METAARKTSAGEVAAATLDSFCGTNTRRSMISQQALFDASLAFHEFFPRDFDAALPRLALSFYTL